MQLTWMSLGSVFEVPPSLLCFHVYKAHVYKFLILACTQAYNAQMCHYNVLEQHVSWEPASCGSDDLLLRLITFNTFMAFKRDLRVFILPMFTSYVPSLSNFFLPRHWLKKKLRNYRKCFLPSLLWLGSSLSLLKLLVSLIVSTSRK